MDDLEIATASALFAYWRDHTPLLAMGKMFASFMGAEPSKSKPQMENDDDATARAMAAELGGEGMGKTTWQRPTRKSPFYSA